MSPEELMKEQIRLVLETGDFATAANMASAAAAYVLAKGPYTFGDDDDGAYDDEAHHEEESEFTEDQDTEAEQDSKDALAFAQARRARYSSNPLRSQTDPDHV